MPLEFCFIDNADEDDKEWEHHLVEPGEGVLIGPYDSEEEEVVIALMCDKDDEGGVVKVMPAVGALELDAFRDRTTDKLDFPEAIASIAIRA